MSLRDLLERYRSGSASEREKGGYFETLVRVWLQHAPTQRDLYRQVMSYGEWARAQGHDARDTGIDLVAELAEAPGEWCAIQCKFYAEGHRIQRADIDSFFTASGRRPFVRRLIVDTTGLPWSVHAEEALEGQSIDTKRVGLSDIEDSGIDWKAFSVTEKVQLLARKQPRPHQVEALAAVRTGLAEADRGKLIMACGTGKTYTALHIAESMIGKGGRVLFLVPSLSLMSQTIREWSIDSTIPLRSFAVCSDSQVGVRKAADGDVADIDVHDLEIPASTRAADFAARAKLDDPDKLTVVFSTYQSIQAVSSAQLDHGLSDFDRSSLARSRYMPAASTIPTSTSGRFVATSAWSSRATFVSSPDGRREHHTRTPPGPKDAKERGAGIAEAALMRVGLSNKIDAYPEQLSGGQQQRVAIARSLAIEMAFARRAADREDDATLITAVVSGQADLVSTQTAVLAAMNDKRSAGKLVTKFVQQKLNLGIAMPKGETTLKSWLDNWIKAKFASGELNGVFKKFHNRDLPADLVNRAV